MSITTNAELLTAITNWLGGRTDLTSYYADWITLFEAHAARKLKVRPMKTFAQLTVTSGAATLPSDYLGFFEVTQAVSPFASLEFASQTYLDGLFPDFPSGTPRFFYITGQSIVPVPSDNADIILNYYAKNTAVSSALNWLFTNHPDAYLNGALLEAAIFTSDTDAAVVFKARRDEIMNEISLLNFREPSGMAIRVMGQTP